MYKTFLLLLMLLTGCSSNPKYNEIKINDVKVERITIPSNLLTPCIPNTPMSEKDYLSLMIQEREIYLTDYVKELMLNVKDCNIKINKIKNIQEGISN